MEIIMPQFRNALLSLAVLLASGIAACGRGTHSPAPPAEIDAAVVTMADRLGSEGDATSVQQAIALAGFDQVDKNGTVIFLAAKPRQGIAFEQGDATIIAAALRQGPVLSIDDLVGGWAAMALGRNAPDVVRRAKVDAMRAALVADKGAASTLATSRFWAQLIVQLGRTALVPYDLLDPAVPGDALLDPVQAAFLIYRFQAELWAVGRAAAGRPAASPLLSKMPSAVTTPRPCTMTDTEGTIMDGSALVTTQLQGKLIEEAGKTIPEAEKFSKFTEQANAALLVAKVLWTFLAFEVHVSSDSSMLVRTRDRTPGDYAAIKASFRMNTGNAQVMNCIRPALNVLGIDFDLPQGGPIANAGVDWEMANVYDRLEAHKQIVFFKDWQLGHHTDPAGEDTVDVMGSPKEPPITGDFMPDFRLVPIRAKVALKDTKLVQDLIDAVDTASTKNPAVAALSFVYETLIRTKSLVFAGRYRLPVQDHLPKANIAISVQLTGHADGTVTASGKGHQSADSVVYYTARSKPDTKPLTFVSVYGSSDSSGYTVLKENSLRMYDYKGAYDVSTRCICASGNAVTNSSASLTGVSATDDKDLTLVADLKPSGSYTIKLLLGSAVLRGAYHYKATGCGDPEEMRDNELLEGADFGRVTIKGTIDMTKSGGKLEGVVPVTITQAIPDKLGGFYQGGVAQSSLSLKGEVRYSIDYVLQIIRLPNQPAPADEAASTQSEALASSEASSTTAPWVVEAHTARLHACF